ncbi:MAG: copper amine oxidase N-terminal domain-containing protein [Armatimonadota bacterium]
MRRIVNVLALVVCILSAIVLAVCAEDVPVRVFVNGSEQKMTPPALMRDGTVYVSLQAGADALGAEVKWNSDKQEAAITLGNKRARISQSQGITIDGVMLISLRLISESLDCDVKWDGASKAVRVTKSTPVPIGGG